MHPNAANTVCDGLSHLDIWSTALTLFKKYFLGIVRWTAYNSLMINPL